MTRTKTRILVFASVIFFAIIFANVRFSFADDRHPLVGVWEANIIYGGASKTAIAKLQVEQKAKKRGVFGILFLCIYSWRV